MKDAKAIRKHTAQHDLFNRIHSIAADEAFVQKVKNEWYAGRFEVVPNQRCGTWYCDPTTSSKAYAYFKSTDGHTNVGLSAGLPVWVLGSRQNWNFNLRRSNLPFATYAEKNGGLILVDSTRRGKRMPDALSKTVPIWCTVINLALQMRRDDQDEESSTGEWDTNLYLPPNIVSPSERSQIQALIPTWAASLDVSTLNIPDLRKPLRPFFIHPATNSPPQIPDDASFTPIICVSASRWVGAGGDDVPSVTRVDRRTVSYEYVPGAGDDDELWARGLKPAIYHLKRDQLLAADRDDLGDLVDDIVRGSQELSLDGLRLSTDDDAPTTASTCVGVPHPASGIAVDIGRTTSPCEAFKSPSRTVALYIAEADRPTKGASRICPLNARGDLCAIVPNPRNDGKAYSKFLSTVIEKCRDLRSANTGVVIRPARLSDLESAIAAMGPQRTDVNLPASDLTDVEMIAARKVIIPLLVALDCALDLVQGPDSHAGDGDSEEESEEGGPIIDKTVIADSLHRLVALWPDGNPPRAALKRVNEVLMSASHA